MARRLHNTTYSFAHYGEGGRDYLMGFINMLLEDGRYTIFVDFRHGHFVAEPSNYMQLPRTNMEYENVDPNIIDELLEFANSVFGDKNYRKVVVFEDGHFFLQPAEDPDDDDEADEVNPQDNQNVDQPPFNHFFTKLAVVKAIMEGVLESNATEANPMQRQQLEDLVLGKLEQLGVDVQGHHCFLTYDVLTHYRLSLNQILHNIPLFGGGENVRFFTFPDGRCYLGNA